MSERSNLTEDLRAEARRHGVPKQQQRLTGRPGSLATLAMLGLSFAVHAQECTTQVDVVVRAARTGGCALSTCVPATVARWRAIKGGVGWRSKRGPWGPQTLFTCAAFGIGEPTRTQADYILFDYDLGPPACLAGTLPCP